MGKNIQKVQDMVDGNYKSKIQIGTHIEKDVHANRKVGDIWTDSDGDQWEQKEGYRSKVSTLAAKGLGDNCPDCKKLIVKGWDKDSYKWNKRCYYCQIDHEAESPRNIQGVDHQPGLSPNPILKSSALMRRIQVVRPASTLAAPAENLSRHS